MRISTDKSEAETGVGGIMAIFNVPVEGQVYIFAKDEDEAIAMVREKIESRANFDGLIQELRVAKRRDPVGGGCQPAADGSGKVPPGDE